MGVNVIGMDETKGEIPFRRAPALTYIPQSGSYVPWDRIVNDAVKNA